MQAYFNGLPNMIKAFTYTHKGGLNSDPPYTFMSIVRGGSNTLKGGLPPRLPRQIDHWM